MCTALALGACGSNGNDDVPSDDPPAQGGTSGGPTGTDTGPGTDAGPGTSPGTDTPPAAGGTGRASRYGVIGVEQTAGEGIEEASIFASFFSFDRALPVDALESGVRPAPDSCIVTEIDLDEDSSDLGLPDLDDVDFTSLGAGDPIAVTDPDGRLYANLSRQDVSGFILYASEDDALSLPVPSGLVVDVPGDDFPAFAAVSIPDVAPLTGVSPAANEPADENSTFRWDAAGGDSRVDIDLIFVLSDPLVSVTCSAVDDGEFALPASALAQIPEGGSAVAQLSRTAFGLRRSDDAVLIATRTATAR